MTLQLNDEIEEKVTHQIGFIYFFYLSHQMIAYQKNPAT